MIEDEISVIPMNETSFNEQCEETKDTKRNNLRENDKSQWGMLHVFSVLAVCIVFSSPLTVIRRTNSIFYQTHWLEFNIVTGIFFVLRAGNQILSMSTWFNERSLYSFRMLLRMYLLYMILWIVPYLIAYFIWCNYLEYNWPIPYLGYNYVLSNIGFLAGIWILLPHDLLSKPEFKRNVKLYILHSFLDIGLSCLGEGISYLFEALPAYLQWIVAFLIPLLKHFDKWSQSKLVNRMTGGKNEASKVLLGLAVNVHYSNFIAVRLSGAEIMTVCFIIAVDFVLQLQMTYKIVRIHNKIANKTIKNGNEDKQKIVTGLVLTELTEAITPIVYATVFSMAYYGPNARILGNVNEVDDVGYLFQMMLLLFGIDILSLIVNSQILSRLTDVNLYEKSCETMKRYWTFMAIKFALYSFTHFATKDINLGMDTTGEWGWTTQEGRIQLINNSTDLTDEEKTILLSQRF